MTIYRSYDVTIGVRVGDVLFVNQEKYSRTTSKHVTQMLNEEKGYTIQVVSSLVIEQMIPRYGVTYKVFHGACRRAII